MDFNRFQFIEVEGYGECLPGPQAVVYCRWFTGANYVGLRAGVLTYQVYGQPERTVHPIQCDGVDLYPIKEMNDFQELK
jgi:hypothetical protein